MSDLKDKIKAIDGSKSIVNIPTYTFKDILNKLSENGVNIVNDVSELDVNSEVGDFAVVYKPLVISEKSIRDLKVLTNEDFNHETGIIDVTKFNPIQFIKIDDSKNFIGDANVIEEYAAFIRPFNDVYIEIPIILTPELGFPACVVLDTTNTGDHFYLLFTINDDNSITINEDIVNIQGLSFKGLSAFNEFLANEPILYIGSNKQIENLNYTPPENYYNCFDNIKVLNSTPPTLDLYIKRDNWELFKDADVINNTNELSVINEKLDYTVNLIDDIQIENSNFARIIANHYLRLTPVYSGDIGIFFNETSFSENVLNKYTIEIINDKTTTFNFYLYSSNNRANILWADDVSPTGEAGYRYLITIENGFGSFRKFPL